MTPNNQLIATLMEEQELPPIQITFDDIAEANQLSLHCPICSNPVERHAEVRELVPVVCRGCGTLYHRACWEQGGGKCAVLGCASTSYRLYAEPTTPALTITHKDVAQNVERGRENGRSPSPRTKELKDQQRREVERLRRPGFWQRLWKWLLDQIQIG